MTDTQFATWAAVDYLARLLDCGCVKRVRRTARALATSMNDVIAV
ncbi:hypothetical protein SB861_30230 [Paraburkholderia sp. SIMBA_049]